jgi:hypothetical protein
LGSTLEKNAVFPHILASRKLCARILRRAGIFASANRAGAKSNTSQSSRGKRWIITESSFQRSCDRNSNGFWR